MKLFLLLTFFTVQIASAQYANANEQLFEYESVDVKPSFPNGINAFFKFIGKNFVVPADDLSGIIKVNFIIEANGTISSVNIVNDIGGGTAEETKRVFALSPKWLPGEYEGKRVRVLYKEFPIKIDTQ